MEATSNGIRRHPETGSSLSDCQSARLRVLALSGRCPGGCPGSHGALSSHATTTTASGPFFTVVTETEVESFAAWEESFRTAMDQPWMGEWFSRMVPLVESGSREFYSVVE
jgi:hypothetical protein